MRGEGVDEGGGSECQNQFVRNTFFSGFSFFN